MSKVYKFSIKNDLVEYIQRLDIEMSAQKAVIMSMIDLYRDEKGMMEWDSFQSYHKKFEALNAEYNLAIQQFTETYIPQELSTHQHKWTINYTTNTCSLTIDCDCGIKAYESCYAKETEAE